MTQFIYTHHQGGEGRLTQVQLPHEERPDYIFKPIVHNAIGFSTSDNGKTFVEDEFEVKYEPECGDAGCRDPHCRKPIAVPLSEKMEGSDAMGIKDFIHKGIEFSQMPQFKDSGESYRMGVGFGYSCGYQDGLKEVVSEKREERTQDELEDERILNDAKIDAMVLDWLDSTKEQWATMSIKDLLVGFYKYLLTLNKQ